MRYALPTLPHTIKAALICGLALALVPAPAFAFFSDSSTATGQHFGAGTLTLEHTTMTPNAVTVGPTTQSTSSVPIATESGSLPAQYDIATESTGGSATLCADLDITATAPAGSTHTGEANTFTSGPHTTEGSWDLVFSTETDAQPLDGATCALTFRIATWQENMNKGTGFTDERDVTISVTYMYDDSAGKEEGTTEETNGDEGDLDQGTTDETGPTVVLNELHWAGSDASGLDQWIELRNLSDDPADISGWQIGNGQSGGGTSTIPADTSIPGDSVFLIARYTPDEADSALSENVTVDYVDTVNLTNTYSSNGPVILSTDDGTEVDRTPAADSSSWPAGKNQTGDPVEKWSMQRGVNPGDGTDPNSWYTCTPSVLDADGTLATMLEYWKDAYEDTACGTPGHFNLSSNDPTKDGYDPNWDAATSATDDSAEEDDEAEDDTENENTDDTDQEEDATEDGVEKRKEDDEDGSGEGGSTEDTEEAAEDDAEKQEDSDDTSDTTSEAALREEEKKPEDDDPAEDTGADNDQVDDGGSDTDDNENMADGESKESDTDVSADDTDETDDEGSSADDDMTIDDSGSTPEEDDNNE